MHDLAASSALTGSGKDEANRPTDLLLPPSAHSPGRHNSS